MAVLHLLTVVLLLAVSQQSDDHLSHAGRALRLGVALLPFPLAVLVGLLSLPSTALGIVAPGIVAAYPEASWHTLSFDAGATTSELAWWALIGSYAFAVGVWGARGRKAIRAENALFVGSLVFMAFALAHLYSGAKSILGVLPVNDPPTWFFAPFVNANFFGTVLLLAFPLAIGEAMRARTEGGNTAMAPFAALAVALLLFMMSLGSFSTLLALAVELVLMLWLVDNVGTGTKLGVAVTGLVSLVCAFFFMLWIEPDWWRVSVEPRIVQWADAPAVFTQHWLAGTGGGAYGEAYPPYRHVVAFLQFTHMHMDPLEWVVETGVVGIVALGAAWWLFPRGAPGTRRRFWTIGLLGALASAFWNFPLQIAGIALCFVGLLAVRAVCFDTAERVDSTTVRRTLYGLAALQLLAVGWQLRAQVVDHAVAVLESEHATPPERREAAERLALLGPGQPALAIHDAREAERAGRTDEARKLAVAVEQTHPADAAALRRAALILWRLDDEDEALRLLARAAVRDPNDFRTWVAISRIHRANLRGGDAATAFAEALRRWPQEQAENGRPFDEAWSLLPLGEYWLEAFSDAPGFWSWTLAKRMLANDEPELALQAIEQASVLEKEIYAETAVWVPILDANGRTAEAEATAKRLIDEHPENQWNWRAYGDLLNSQGRHQEAAQLYLRGFEYNRRWTALALFAVRASAEADGPEKALALVHGIDVHVRHDPRIDLEAARLHLAAGQPGDCVLRLEGLETTDPRLDKRAEALRQRCGAGR